LGDRGADASARSGDDRGALSFSCHGTCSCLSLVESLGEKR
jgi:hypothetical protein